jgi:hypothetical protein
MLDLIMLLRTTKVKSQLLSSSSVSKHPKTTTQQPCPVVS